MEVSFPLFGIIGSPPFGSIPLLAPVGKGKGTLYRGSWDRGIEVDPLLGSEEAKFKIPSDSSVH